ncbi:MAG: hypothetical protein M1830_000238 [Pleopsidium flavum]|nr:MAG: hypothetical protein M1830_000238 [Pleopsidium flavum]
MACRECASGSLHEGTPVGRVETVHGFPTYISEPPSGQAPKGIIVIIPDALGWTFNNNRILADTYAKRTDSRVYLPEFMEGHHMSVSLFASMDTITGTGWMIGKILPLAHAISAFVPFLFFNRLAVTKPRVYKFFHGLRANEAASLPVGAAGFCWGGKFVFLLCSDSEKAANGKSLIDCGFTAHPSNLAIPADAHDVTLPLSLAVGDVDIAMPLAQVQQAKDILEEKGKDTHEVVIIPGARHGFAIRAHPDDEKAVEQGKQAEEQAVNWFTKWFEKAS